MAKEDDKKTQRIDLTNPGEADPTIASTRSDRTSGSTMGERGSSTEINQPADRFTLTQVLGEGTQGEVCKAFDNLLHRHVAIKFPHRTGDDQVAQDILQEARKAARLNHPNVVTIYEVGFWKGRPFIAMELIEGVSLATVLKECGRISVDRFLKYARQILRALGAAHRSGLIHRDLKPHNVLLSAEGTLKLTDFGVAHVGSGIGADKTVQFKIAGTPAYMAPEQWSGLTPDARSDIYAFGCMAYKLLSGQSVFPAEETMKHHLESKPRALRSLAPNVPETLERILMRCLEKKPENRYQSCKELLDAIEHGAKTGGGDGTASWPIEAGVKKRKPVALLVLLLLVAGFAAFLFVTPEGRDLRGKLLAAAGVEPAKDRPRPEPRVEPPAPITDTSAAELEKRQSEGRAELEEAQTLVGQMDSMSLERCQELARSAVDKLSGLPEAETARKLLTEAGAARARLTEKMKVSDFKALLDQSRSELAAGRLAAAGQKLASAENLMSSEAVLRQYGEDLNRVKLPLVQHLADEAARGGRFAEASLLFDQASGLADQLKQGSPRDQFQRDAQTCSTLDSLSRNCGDQPRYVVLQLDGMSRALDRFPAARLTQAEAWLSLGGFAESRGAIEGLLGANPPPELAADAERLLALLPQ